MPTLTTFIPPKTENTRHSAQERETSKKKQIKSFCTANETITKTKRQPTDWDKIFANNIFVKTLISKIFKEFVQFNIKITNN